MEEDERDGQENQPEPDGSGSEDEGKEEPPAIGDATSRSR